MFVIFLIGVFKNVILIEFYWYFISGFKILINEYVEFWDYIFKKFVYFEKVF